MGGDSKVGTRRSSVGGNHDPVSVKARSAQASSGSTDPSMSIGSNGEAVLSNRVWTLHRFIRGIKKGKVPLNLILILFISLLTAGVAGLAWGLTYTAATVRVLILFQVAKDMASIILLIRGRLLQPPSLRRSKLKCCLESRQQSTSTFVPPSKAL